jgi:hypothetical protein
MRGGYVDLENFLPEADVEAEGDQWLKAINGALQRDRLSTNEVKFGPLTFKKDVVLNSLFAQKPFESSDGFFGVRIKWLHSDTCLVHYFVTST